MREAEEEIGLVLTLADLTPLGRRFAHRIGGTDNEVQEVFALRSDLALDHYRLHPDEVEGVVSVGLDDAIELFEGVVEAVPALELRRDAASAVPAAVDVAVSDFAAGEVGGYAVRALRGLRVVVAVARRSRSSCAERCWCVVLFRRGEACLARPPRGGGSSGRQRLEAEPAVMLVGRVDDGKRITLCPLAEARRGRSGDR